MKKVSARELKARCLALIDNVQKTKKPVAITKRGKVVANSSRMNQQIESSWDGWRES